MEKEVPMETSNEPKAPKDKIEKDSLVKNLQALEEWTIVSNNIFKYESKLEKSKALQLKLEKKFPFLGQVKGIVRNKSRGAPVAEKSPPNPEKPKKPEKDTPKKRKEPDEERKTPKGKKALEERMKEIKQRGEPVRSEGFKPTTHEVKKDLFTEL
jgi:hypothetical protein